MSRSATPRAARVNRSYHPYIRAREALTGNRSARRYGVVRQREGSRKNGMGPSRMLTFRKMQKKIGLRKMHPKKKVENAAGEKVGRTRPCGGNPRMAARRS